MTTNTALVVAALRELAEAEEACRELQGVPRQEIWGGPHSPICSCHGTGRVPLFRSTEGKALFRKVCKNLVLDAHDVQYGFGDRHHPDKCYVCHGPGWLPLDVNEVHLEMVLAVAYNIESERMATTFHTYTKLIAALDDLPRGSGPLDFVEAAILALDAAMEARG